MQVTLPTPATATGTIANDDTPPIVSILPYETPILEGENPKFTISREGLTDDRLDVQISLAKDGIAEPDRTAVIPAGQASTVHVVNHADDSVEGVDHQYVATVESSTADYLIGIPGSATVDVLDDDKDRGFLLGSYADPDVFEEAGDVIDFNYEVTNSGTAETAVPLIIYSRNLGEFTIDEQPLQPGFEHVIYITKTYTVTSQDVANGSITESWYVSDGITRSAYDSFSVTLEDAVQYVISNPASEDSTKDDEDSGTFNLGIVRVDNSTDPDTVNYYTRSDTADRNVDFTSVSGTLTFPTGSTGLIPPRQTVSIPITDDDLDEPYEHFVMVVEDDVQDADGKHAETRRN